jgi:hypothetical protein
MGANVEMIGVATMGRPTPSTPLENPPRARAAKATIMVEIVRSMIRRIPMVFGPIVNGKRARSWRRAGSQGAWPDF